MPVEYVACLTTIPSRIHFVHLTVNSLLNQKRPFDRIYVCIPHMSARFDCAYDIPESLSSRSDIVILRGTDYGPATKVLGLLEANLPDIGPSTRIFYCDDDRIYDPDRSSEFYDASIAHPDSVICQATTPYWKFFVDGNAGYEYNSQGLFPAGKHLIQNGHVDIAEGFGGVVIQPRFVTKDVFAIPANCRLVDDIWLSGHVLKNKWTIWGITTRTPIPHKGDEQDPLYLLKGTQDRRTCNAACINYYQTTHGLWESIEAITLDQKLIVPTIENVHRLLHTIRGLETPLRLTTSVDTLPLVQQPDEYIVELKTTPSVEKTVKTLVSELIPDCEHVHGLIQSYKTTVRYLADAKLLTKESEDKLLAPIQQLVKDKQIKERIDTFIKAYTTYRETILRTSLFRSRLLCHACKKRVYHYVAIPCGHLVCDECKASPCKVCTRPVSTMQLVAIVNSAN